MDINQLEDRIREFINTHRMQSVLLLDLEKWNQLCSSLDLIGDTELAIQSYPILCLWQDKIQNQGASYLIIYGILQTLLLQQDAAKKIGDCLKITVKPPSQLENIRAIRNSAVGHPIYQKEYGITRSCFIIRHSVNPLVFELIKAYAENKKDETIFVNIPELISLQKQYLSEFLQKVIFELEKQEMEHKKKYSDQKLVDLLPLNYHFGKVSESVDHSEKFQIGNINVITIEQCVDNFKAELLRRGEWDSDSIGYHYDKIIYAITELKRYFGFGGSKLNEIDAYIFAFFLHKEVNYLRDIAKIIDEDYEFNT